MLRMTVLAFLGFVATTAGIAPAACTGADPALTSVAVKSVTRANGINRYTLVGTVVNDGAQAQASNVLQFVDISQTPGEKLDSKGIPPLKAGESSTFSYVLLRSAESGDGTTTLRFQLDMRQPAASGAADCNAGNDSFSVTF
jgi:hypothetical protein